MFSILADVPLTSYTLAGRIYGVKFENSTGHQEQEQPYII